MDRQEHSPEEAAALWPQLQLLCQQALRVSHEIAACLQRGAGAHQCLPLLRRQLELAEQLRTGIHHLAHQPRNPLSRRWRAHLARQLQALLALDQRNSARMHHSGIRIHAHHR